MSKTKKPKAEKGLFQELIRDMKTMRHGKFTEHEVTIIEAIRVVQVDATQLMLFANEAARASNEVGGIADMTEEEIIALPVEDAYERGQRMRLALTEMIHMPFDLTLIEVLEGDEEFGKDGHPYFAGALCSTITNEISGELEVLSVAPYVKVNNVLEKIAGFKFQDGEWDFSPIEENYKDNKKMYEAVSNMAEQSINCIAAFSMLLESANVDIEPAPEERQYPRGHVARKYNVLKHEIVIRQSRSTSRPRSHGENHRDFKYRFERRAHFKHHYELTAEGNPNRIFAAWKRDRPEKVITYNGKECVRIWHSASVVGPEDAPLVPKTRRVK